MGRSNGYGPFTVVTTVMIRIVGSENVRGKTQTLKFVIIYSEYTQTGKVAALQEFLTFCSCRADVAVVQTLEANAWVVDLQHNKCIPYGSYPKLLALGVGQEWDPEIRNEVIWADTEEAQKFKPSNPLVLLPSGNPFLMHKCPS